MFVSTILIANRQKMKKSFLLFVVASFFSHSNAQQVNFGIDGVKPMGSPMEKILDVSHSAYLYRHDIYDTVLEKEKTNYELLQIGNKWSKYGGYNDYRSDSIRYKNPSITVTQYFEWTKKNRELNSFCFKNIVVHNLVVRDRVLSNNYIYEEPFPQFDWKLSNETTTILGHKCQKATTTFRGRRWIVWYADDIPISDGPWKFCGLPGLVLRATDSKGEHKYEAVAIRKMSEDFGYSDRRYVKTTREKFNKAKLDYNNEAWKMFTGELTPRNADGTPIEIPHRKLFFNPEELE